MSNSFRGNKMDVEVWGNIDYSVCIDKTLYGWKPAMSVDHLA